MQVLVFACRDLFDRITKLLTAHCLQKNTGIIISNRMGFIEDLFGKQNLELEVQGYFAGTRSTYDAMRMCMHEMVSLKYYSNKLSHNHIDKIRAELFRNAEEQYMRDYYQVAEQRCRVDRDYTFSPDFWRTFN